MLRPHLANSLRLSLMGAWLMGTVFLWVIATENFRRVDAVLDSPHPEFHQRLEPLPAGEARIVLRSWPPSSIASTSPSGDGPS